jgi:hypothetical protein
VVVVAAVAGDPAGAQLVGPDYPGSVSSGSFGFVRGMSKSVDLKPANGRSSTNVQRAG